MSFIKSFKRRINKVLHPEWGHILMLHRVVESRSRLKENRNIEITPQFLESTIIKYLNKGFRFVSLDEINSIISQKHYNPIFQKKFVCFTLDDGYRDNFEVAYPIFKKYNVPFAINVTTDFLNRKALLWWYALEQLGVSDDEFEIFRQKVFVMKKEDIEIAFNNRFPQGAFSFPAIISEMAMTENQLKEIAQDPLCTIGCHTVTHTKLDILSETEQMREIVVAKNHLQQLLGQEILYFAYPYGFYNDCTLSLLSQCGICLAMRTYGGKIYRSSNCFELPRIELKQD